MVCCVFLVGAPYRLGLLAIGGHWLFCCTPFPKNNDIPSISLFLGGYLVEGENVMVFFLLFFTSRVDLDLDLDLDPPSHTRFCYHQWPNLVPMYLFFPFLLFFELLVQIYPPEGAEPPTLSPMFNLIGSLEPKDADYAFLRGFTLGGGSVPPPLF